MLTAKSSVKKIDLQLLLEVTGHFVVFINIEDASDIIIIIIFIIIIIIIILFFDKLQVKINF